MARARWTSTSRVEHTCAAGHTIPTPDGYWTAEALDIAGSVGF